MGGRPERYAPLLGDVLNWRAFRSLFAHLCDCGFGKFGLLAHRADLVSAVFSRIGGIFCERAPSQIWEVVVRLASVFVARDESFRLLPDKRDQY
jgi:hypothetical protein